MKVLHIISGGDSGGAKTHMFTMLDELCKMASVTVVCLMSGVFYKEILERDVRTVLFEQKGRYDFSVVKKIAALVNDEGFDIVNAHGARANFIAMFLKKRIGVPIVTTVHSDYLLDFDTFAKKLVFENLNRVALKKIDYKIGVSEAFSDMLVDRGFEPNNIFTVYNGIEFNELPEPQSREEFAKKHGIPYEPDKIYVGIAARFDRVKGVDVFIRAAAEVLRRSDKARFVIIGDGEEENNLRALCRELNIDDRVYFLGFVREVYDFYNFIDINMLTSLSESFPYALLEGAHARKATVASRVGGIPYLIIDGETGLLFESRDHNGCADMICSLIDNPSKIGEFGEAIYNKAKNEFSNRALAEAYLRNYGLIIKKYNKKKKYDIVLSGYYGFDNVGDEMILTTLVKSFKKYRPDVDILVLSKQPEKTKKLLRVNSSGRFRVFWHSSVLRRGKIFINGGGTLLTDVTSTRSLLYYIYVMRLAKNMGMKIALLGGGVGPFLSEKNKNIAVSMLKSAELITLRDKASYNLLKENGVEKIRLTADVAFLFERDMLLGRPVKDTEFPKGKYYVVSLREWSNNCPDFENIIANSCDRISEKYGMTAVFIPMQREYDLEISKRVAGNMKTLSYVADENRTINSVLSLISEARFSLGMRLHNVICSAVAGTPVIALSYDDKVKNFVSENNVGEFLDTSSLTQKELDCSLERVMEQNEHIALENLSDLREKSRENITLALSLLDEE